MSIVIGLENPYAGPPLLYLIDPDHRGGVNGRPMPIKKNLVSALDARVQQLPTDPQPDVLMKEIGEGLLDLLSLHPDIADTVKRKLDRNRTHEEPIYLYFKHRMDDLERWPWEALYAPNVGFVSQNENFAVARSQYGNNGKTEWSFELPLRILAVLGASGDTADTRIEGDEQWRSLQAAVDAARKNNLEVELRILTCQKKLMQGINRQNLAWVRADLIPPSAPARAGGRLPDVGTGVGPRDLLFSYIGDYAPHILHVFSHASSDPTPHLEVGTYSDWERKMPGSIQIDGVQLKQRADKESKIWLITLNCCETATYGPGTSSLSMPVAAALASQGTPAVVGMREKIPSSFANAFAEQFYSHLLSDLRTRISRVPTAGGLVDIHWACGLFAVRQRASNGASQHVLEWTLPVMHTAFDFKLTVRKPLAAPAPASMDAAAGSPEPASAPARRVVRPARRGPPLPAAAKPRALSAKKLAELEDELIQLREDRKLVVANKPVVKVIDKRIATIVRRLNQA